MPVNEYICGQCGKIFFGEARIYARHHKRRYKVFCSSDCSISGAKERKRFNDAKYEANRPTRTRVRIMEKVKKWKRDHYSRSRYGEFSEAHRTLLNLTKPMWRNK